MPGDYQRIFKKKSKHGIYTLYNLGVVPLLFVQMPHAEVVTFGFHFKVGSRDETVKNNGISHFVEHLLMSGGTSKISPKKTKEQFGREEQTSNACTSKENTSYFTTTLPQHIIERWNFLSELVLNASFSPEEVENQRNIICNEIDDHYPNKKKDRGLFEFSEQIDENKNIGYQPAGLSENVRRFSRDDLYTFYKKRYTPEKCCVVICGNFDEAELLKVISRDLLNWQNKPFADCESRSPLKESRTSQIEITDDDMHNIYAGLNSYTPMKAEDSHHAFKTQSRLVQAAVSKTANDMLRHQKSALYGVNVQLDEISDGAHLLINNRIDATNSLSPKDWLVQIFESIQRIERSFSFELLQQLTTERSFRNKLSGPPSTMQFFEGSGFSLLHDIPIITREEFDEIYKNTSPEEVRAMLKRLTNPEKVKWTLRGPEKSLPGNAPLKFKVI